MPRGGQRDGQLQQSYPLDHPQGLLQDEATHDAGDEDAGEAQQVVHGRRQVEVRHKDLSL